MKMSKLCDKFFLLYKFRYVYIFYLQPFKTGKNESESELKFDECESNPKNLDHERTTT